MASGEEDDLNIPVFRIDESEIVDLAALLDDRPASPTKASDSREGWDEVTFAEPEATRPEASPSALSASPQQSQQQGNVFHLDITEDSDFEALLNRTMGATKDAPAPPPQQAPGQPQLPTTGPQNKLGGPRLSEQDIDKMLTMLDDGPDDAPFGGQAEPARRPAPSQPPIRGVPAGAMTPPVGGMPPRGPQESARVQESKAIEEMRQKVKDLAAETDRYKARIADEAEGARNKGREDVFKALMPIIDTLELALNSASGQGNAAQFTEGIGLVLKRFEVDLKQLGLEVISPMGAPFNPKHHEALQRVNTGKVAPGSVAEVVRRGYRMGDKLLRAAQVFVEAG